MARRQRQLVSQLRQRELGIRRARLDAPAHRQHQRFADQRRRAQIPLAAWPPPERSSVAQRTPTLSSLEGATAPPPLPIWLTHPENTYGFYDQDKGSRSPR